MSAVSYSLRELKSYAFEKRCNFFAKLANLLRELSLRGIHHGDLFMADSNSANVMINVTEGNPEPVLIDFETATYPGGLNKVYIVLFVLIMKQVNPSEQESDIKSFIYLAAEILSSPSEEWAKQTAEVIAKLKEIQEKLPSQDNLIKQKQEEHLGGSKYDTFFKNVNDYLRTLQTTPFFIPENQMKRNTIVSNRHTMYQIS